MNAQLNVGTRNSMRYAEPSMRNCFRCGREFLAPDGNQRVCSDCRLPKPRKLNPELTPREKQVARLVSQAMVNKEIAFVLHLTEGAIKVYLHRIFRKVGVENRTALALWEVRREQSGGEQ